MYYFIRLFNNDKYISKLFTFYSIRSIFSSTQHEKQIRNNLCLQVNIILFVWLKNKQDYGYK